MTHEEYMDYLASHEWAKKRLERIGIDGFRCCVCISGETDYPLEVHHLTYDNIGDEDVENDLITLCSACHAALHRMRNALSPLVDGDKNVFISTAIDVVVGEAWMRDVLSGQYMACTPDNMAGPHAVYELLTLAVDKSLAEKGVAMADSDLWRMVESDICSKARYGDLDDEEWWRWICEFSGRPREVITEILARHGFFKPEKKFQEWGSRTCAHAEACRRMRSRAKEQTGKDITMGCKKETCETYEKKPDAVFGDKLRVN